MASRWFTLALLLTPSLALDNDFSFYPKGAQSCLNKAADDADCTGKDSKELNYCLCGQGSYKNDFILGSARCIGDESPDDVDETYDTMKTACTTSETPLKVTKKEFQDAAAEGETTTTTDAPTSTTTTSKETGEYTTTSGGKTVTVVPTSGNSNSGSSDDESSGLSTGATIGIGVGAALGGAALVGAAIFFFLRRRKRNVEESHPMLPNYEASNEYAGSTTYPPTEPKPAWSAAGTPNPSQQGWASPNPYTPGGYSPQPGVAAGLAPQAPPAHNVVYEMDGTGTGAIEMPGSIPHDNNNHGGATR
ncbi:hypothetical protein FDECE_3111 [Fusarium decemcellulare]|nr:hypothetical protein FDECE_3111 [Fusarium decemcellulare]